MKRTVIALPSDTHSGSTLGLIPAKQFPLKDGSYDPSPAQRLIWRQWEHNWKLIANERKNSDLIVVHGGDLVEGIHHQTTQVISPRVDDHETASIVCMDKAFRLAGMNKGDKYYQISGTEEHAGNGSSSEERVAKDLDHVVPVWEEKIFDEAGVAKRVYTDNERAWFYNGGSGRTYSELVSDIKTVNGILRASVKTVNGIAIASVGSINGIT